MFRTLTAVALFATLGALAGEHHAPVASAPKNWDQVKGLAGQWEGTSSMNGKEEPAVVTYELTSGGSALIERLFPGTPHEMVSVYHGENGKTVMTHYCALGNHPKLDLKSADKNVLAFEMHGLSGIASAKEPHMHALTVTLVDPDHIKQEWISWEGGKKKDTTVITLARKK